MGWVSLLLNFNYENTPLYKPTEINRCSPTQQLYSNTMKLTLLAFIFVPIVLVQVGINVAQATSTRVPLLINPQALKPQRYVTITGCNNDCDIACCYCDIKKQPPVCVQCCQE